VCLKEGGKHAYRARQPAHTRLIIFPTHRFSQGERDYARIAGPTGPLVYPAGHVWLHTGLRALTGGGSIAAAQWVLAALYLASQALALGLAIASRGVPPAALPLLAASKRLHSIYVLRLFNDCWSSTLVRGGVFFVCVGVGARTTIFCE
jgi:alpha-1,3-mannosyltransferase